MPITILLVDDHALFRKGLRLLLEKEPDMSVVGEAGDGKEAIERVLELSPDIVVMDITMPNLDGREATRQILSKSPDLKVVALSMHSGKQFVEGMLHAGVAGYILKDSVPEEMIQGIRTVLAGDVYLSRSISGIVVSEYKKLLSKTGPTVETSSESILHTKLHRPQNQEDHLHRQRLYDLFDQPRRTSLTLVSAPAGYGKTTLASCWLETNDNLSAWVSLDENDNDLHRFLSYFLAAIQTMFPDAGRKTMAMVNTSMLPPVSALAGNLINELNLIEQPFILVLDDFHLIKDESVLDLLTQLLHHPPQAMYLVLIGRRDPSLPISMLRAKGLVTEIRTQDLRFNEMETATFLTQMLGTHVDSVTAAAVEEKTEGWVTGLRLAALSMRHRGNLDPKLLEPQVDAQYVMEYLFTEVLSVQSPEISQYLMGTAILDRFCGPLCEAVCVPGVDPLTSEFNGWNFIAWLKSENMFLFPLDSEGRWFRYHHLFHRLLVKQLKRRCSAEEINALHARASAWFAENGLIEEALPHALAGDNPMAAARLVARHGFDLMNDEQWPRLEDWLRLVPIDIVDQEPELLLLMAWTHVVYSRFAELSSCVDKAEALLSAPPDTSATAEHNQGHIDALRGFQHFMAADGKGALTCAKRACETIPRQHQWARIFAFINRAGAYQMLGDRKEALSTIEAARQDKTLGPGAYLKANPCFIYWMEADLSAMLQTAEQSLKLGDDRQPPQALAHGLYFQGIALYHRNELHAAEEKLVTVIKDRYGQHSWNYAHSAFALALIYQVWDRPDEANKIGESVESHALDNNNTAVLQIARAFQAELALRQGRLAEASYWAKLFVAKPFIPMYRFYVPQFTLVRVLLAQDTMGSREQAYHLLKDLYDFVSFTHNTRFLIEVLTLQALRHDSQDDEPAGLKTLTEALTLAEPGGFIRLFVDLGPQMADLLKQLTKQNVAVGYIGRILAAFKGDAHRAMQGESDRPATHPPPLSTQPLVEPLTNRELEILNLLTQPLQNKEIAAKLFISPETVKAHLNHIYGKLGVTRRRQAVVKADALGILSHH
jgi:LuxR family maltose regulon positive regulatory protein